MPKQKKRPDTLEDNLDLLLENYKRDKEESLIVKGSDDSVATIKGFVSSGNDLLDALMTYVDDEYRPVGRGWALGRWYEVFGPPSSSKSTSTHHLAAEVQKLSGYVIQIDPEKATDDFRAKRMGFNTDKCLRINSDTLEETIYQLQRLFTAFDKRPELLKHPTAILLDSIAVIPTAKELMEGKNKGGMMEKPRVIKDMVRKLCTQMPKYNAVMVMVNQTMTSFKQFRGRTFTGTTTPGGDGPRFQHSIRLAFKEGVKYSESNDERMPGGKFIRVITAKTKLFRPEGVIEIACDYMTGYNNAITNVNFLTNVAGIIKFKKRRYFAPDIGIVKGITYEDMIWRAMEDPDIKLWLRDKVFENSKFIYTGPAEDAEESKEDKKEEGEEDGD